MDKLPNSILLKILTHLPDSSDVARCRVASNSFNTVHPGLKSINLQCSLKHHHNGSTTSRVLISHHIKTVFLNLISKLETVETVSIVVRRPDVRETDDFYLTDDGFANEWMPRVSGSLKSLLVADDGCEGPPSVLRLVSEYCHNLLNLKLQWVWLSVENLKPMLMLTSLTLSFTRLEGGQHLNEFSNNCFPNLQLLNLLGVQGLIHLKIHLLNLKTCCLAAFDNPPYLTIITPNLTRLLIECAQCAELVLDAPMLSYFHLGLSPFRNSGSFTIKKFENLKTLWIGSPYIGSILSDFSITKTVEKLTLDSIYDAPRDPTYQLTLEKMFTVFPNMSSLRINSGAWSELEACLIPAGEEILDGWQGLRTICAYLKLVDSSLTFSYVSRVLDQCVGLSEVSLLIHADVDGGLSESFKSKCVARWPGLKWRWGVWSEEMEDSWITDTVSN